MVSPNVNLTSLNVDEFTVLSLGKKGQVRASEKDKSNAGQLFSRLLRCHSLMHTPAYKWFQESVVGLDG